MFVLSDVELTKEKELFHLLLLYKNITPKLSSLKQIKITYFDYESTIWRGICGDHVSRLYSVLAGRSGVEVERVGPCECQEAGWGLQVVEY